jgi:polyisoprenyl-teichoic acid--peptidoglycan teichoic acid transferase
MGKNHKINKKLKIFLIVLGIFAFIICGSFIGARIYIQSKLSAIKTVDLTKNPNELGIDSSQFDPPYNIDGITNILLLGVDSRDPKSEQGRSDSMMILTIDKMHNKIKITSIMRDSLVNIDGHGQQKITHAHAYGGPLLSLKTVNENYKLNIFDYVQVNFFGLEKIIDYLGGVPINVTAAEIPLIDGGIKAPGLQTLNGKQAVAYSRIRYVGNNDFQRTERQRTVLTALFNKLSLKNVTNVPSIIDNIFPCLESSLKPEAIISIATDVLIHRITKVEQARVPYDDLYRNAVVDHLDVLMWDKEPTIKRLHQFIFEN